MRISSKSKLATNVLLDIAVHTEGGFVISSVMLSKRHSISLSYLDQVLGMMKEAELIRSFRGPGGGYALSKNSMQVTINDIVSLFEPVQETESALSTQLWVSLRLHMQEQMSKTTLSELVQMSQVDLAPNMPRIITQRVSAPTKTISKKANPTTTRNKLGPNSIFTFGKYLATL